MLQYSCSTSGEVGKYMKGRYLMKQKGNKIVAMALAAVVAVGISITPISASTSENDTPMISYSRERSTRLERQLELKTVSGKNVYSYPRLTVRLGDKTVSVQGIVINGVTYLPFRSTANALGASYTYDSSTKSATMRLPGLELTATAGCYVSYANARAMFSVTPNVIMSDGRMYIPIETFTRPTGMTASVSGSTVSIRGSYKPISSAESYYRSDEVLWLARIIHAESRGEPLLGQIAVGNVVLNRVRSSSYPNTIYGVIFDRKYGVQFSPVLDGTIYNTPSYSSTLAAKICLEGYDISEGALFFLRPELSTSSWIPNNRRYAFSIGKHDFYY